MVKNRAVNKANLHANEQIQSTSASSLKPVMKNARSAGLPMPGPPAACAMAVMAPSAMRSRFRCWPPGPRALGN